MRIIVADDSLLVRQLLTSAVEELGHECLAVADGLEAYRLFRERGCDVIISDWSMPALDGLELCRRIRSIPQEGYAYFILLTAYGGQDNLLDAMRAGVDDFLTKPLDKVALEARLIAAARVTTLHRERQSQVARLEALLRASRRFAFEAHPDELLPDVLRAAIDLVGADGGEITCWDERQQAFARKYTVTGPAERRSLHRPSDTNHAAGVTGIVKNDGALDEHGRRTITATMLQGRYVLGTIRLFSSDQHRPFAQADADILELLAGVAAASLVGTERTRLEGVLLAGRTMNHELNNKLALIVGHVELVSSDPRLPSDLADQMAVAIEAGQDASHLLLQLSTLTEIREVDWGAPIGQTIDLKRSSLSASLDGM